MENIINQHLPVGSIITGYGISNSFGSEWLLVHHTIPDDLAKSADISPYRTLAIRTYRGPNDLGESIRSYKNSQIDN